MYRSLLISLLAFASASSAFSMENAKNNISTNIRIRIQSEPRENFRFYPVQRDSFSVPSDWAPGDEIDRNYFIANIVGDHIGYSVVGLDKRILQGRTATFKDGILKFYNFVILLNRPWHFQDKEDFFPRIEEIYYSSQTLAISEAQIAQLSAPKQYSEDTEKIRLNYRLREAGKLCAPRQSLPETYFSIHEETEKAQYNDFLLMTADPSTLSRWAPLAEPSLFERTPAKDIWGNEIDTSFEKQFKHDNFFEQRSSGFREIKESYLESGLAGVYLCLGTWQFNADETKVSTDRFWENRQHGPLSARHKAWAEGTELALEHLLSQLDQKGIRDFRIKYFKNFLSRMKQAEKFYRLGNSDPSPAP